MLKLTSIVVALTLCVALVCAESDQGPQWRQLNSGSSFAIQNHPYVFLTVPRANDKGNELQGFRVVETEDDDDDDESNSTQNYNSVESEDDDDNDEDDDDEGGVNTEDDESDDDEREQFENDDDEDDNLENDISNNLGYLKSHISHTPRLRSQLRSQISSSSLLMPQGSPMNAQLMLKNAKPTNMKVSRGEAGAIMVPDGVIEIEGHNIVDDKTGKTSLLVSREVIDAIPEGSVVALLDTSSATDSSEEGRANRIIVRRRRKGSRRNGVRRRGGGNRRNRRRGGNKRRYIRVYRIGGSQRRRRPNRRPTIIRPVFVQG